ncbi:MAG: hypothetical protein K8R90_10015 [Candidatus Cloacimonetes bacterium]|nr:hypothetical protein [Candidatus Cloacimonadota bacterium]
MTASITILTTVIIALKAAINPIVGVISLLAAGLTAAGFAFAANTVETDNAEEALARYKRQAEEARVKLDGLIAGLTDFNEMVAQSRHAQRVHVQERLYPCLRVLPARGGDHRGARTV